MPVKWGLLPLDLNEKSSKFFHSIFCLWNLLCKYSLTTKNVSVPFKAILWIVHFPLFELAFSFSYSQCLSLHTRYHWRRTPDHLGKSRDALKNLIQPGGSSKVLCKHLFNSFHNPRVRILSFTPLLLVIYTYLDHSYWLDQLQMFFCDEAWGFL